MKRKLIKQGGGGFTFYVPKKWVQERGLKAGDEIDVEEINTKLIISSSSKIKSKIKIKLEDTSKHYIYVKLSHAYRMGFDRMILFYENPETIKKITQVVTDNLLGFEVIQKENNSCTIENVTEPTEEKFSVLLRRIFLQIKETYQAVKGDFIENKKENWEEIKEIRKSLDKHIFFCRRVISKKVNIGENSILHWELLTFLMHIQHSYYYMYEHYYKEQKEKTNKKTLAILLELEEYFNKYYKSYFEKKETYIDRNRQQKQKLFEEIFKELNNQKNKDKVTLSYLKKIVRLIQIGGSPIRALLASEHL
jgi:phosphate uptake regulator